MYLQLKYVVNFQTHFTLTSKIFKLLSLFSYSNLISSSSSPFIKGDCFTFGDITLVEITVPSVKANHICLLNLSGMSNNSFLGRSLYIQQLHIYHICCFSFIKIPIFAECKTWLCNYGSFYSCESFWSLQHRKDICK